MRWPAAFVGCACAAVIVQAGQESRPQPPTFRAGVRVVEVDAVVRDDDDRFVTGLTKDDFDVFEDGRLQEIAAVSMVSLPADRGQPIAPAASLLQSDDVGRVYVMVLNSLHERVHQIAREFIDGFLGSADLMAVMNGDRRVTQGLTNDREELRAEIYNAQWALTPRVGVTTVIQPKDSERVIFRDEQILTSGERGRVYVRGRVPLARFEPGQYRLSIEAYTRDGLPASTSQQLEFEVTD